MSIDDELRERRLESLRVSLGPIVMAALGNPDVVEIMLNDDSSLWIESLGHMRRAGEISFSDAMAILNQVADAVDEQVTKESPIISGVLPLAGERFEGVAPPVTERPIFAIRKPPGKIFTLNDYVRNSILTFSQAETLRQAIKNLNNILVVGGTGTGKTTFCNALLHELSLLLPERRMLMVEDTRELQCALANRVFLRSTFWTSMERIAQSINRLRPDAVSVGEVRSGAPALALLKLWNTGHPGGFGTIHANSGYGGLTRIDQLIQEVSANPQRVLISEAVNIVVYLERTPGGRKIKEISRVVGYDSPEDRFLLEPIH